MRRIGRLAGVLTLGLCAIGVVTFAQGPPPPPRPPQGPPPPPPPPPANATPGLPYPTLNKAELARYQVGKTAFLEAQTVPGGLGPVFNESSCATCHGGTQATGGSGLETVTRFGRYVNNQYDPMTAFGGPTLQARGIGQFNGVNFVAEVVPPQATVVAHRRTAPLFGLGLVDAIPDSLLIALSQQQHQIFPATAGVPNFVVDEATGEERVGRFGWKAQEATLFSFSGNAYLNEMGITTPLFPTENCPQGNCALLAANPAASDPNEPDNDSVQQVADFITFSAPPPPVPPNATTQAGRTLFGAIGCAQCHVPALQAGPNTSATLNFAPFAPYSDFLLHDMGSLGDNIVQNEAGPTQMRTAPLWGLRFEKSFLHDGRASTVDQAILDHQGQGLAASKGYSKLTAAQKAQLLAFLNSL